MKNWEIIADNLSKAGCDRLFLAPRRLWRAFVRSRGSTNLYRLGFDERSLNGTVGALRERLGLRDRLVQCGTKPDPPL